MGFANRRALGQNGAVLIRRRRERVEFPPPKAQPAPGIAQAKGLRTGYGALWKAG